MTLAEMKKKVLGLIEEVNPDNAALTDDPDIATKLNDVINQIMFELARIKKIAHYVDVVVKKGEVLTFEDIGDEVGYDVYQLGTISGVNHKYRANGTAVQFLEDGTAEIDCFVYPERITEKTNDNYEFELSQDALEIMPYGVAADLLKSDISTEYGTIYATRYESMLQRLDPRNNMTSIYVDGGISL
jgi:hypothetical protein